MPSFYFKKLVRDLVPQRCLDDPKVRTDYRILDDDSEWIKYFRSAPDKYEEIV